jgi:Kef-type K+ transport system membrane component KefB
MSTLARIGLAVVAAFGVGRILRMMGSPQVVGYIIAGLLLGPSLLNLIPGELNGSLTFISEVALGLIGFDIGGHLRFDELKKVGKSIVPIVIFEAFGAFALVGLGVYALTGSLPAALIFGSLASATAPAATVEVLCEYKAKGPLTTTLRTVLGIDDAIALLLFSVAAVFAESLMGGSVISVSEMLFLPFYEIGGSLLVGALFGVVLNRLMKRFLESPDEHDSIVLPIGAVFVCAGLAMPLGLSLILTTMTMGFVVVNLNQENGRYIRSTIERVGPIIYVLFFALAGARLHIHEFLTMGALGVVYILLRSTGKFAGAWFGGTLGKADPVIRNNLGLALLTQGGVAIGLALDSAARFGQYGAEGQALGALVITVITATTVVVEIFGPIGVKVAITRAGEVCPDEESVQQPHSYPLPRWRRAFGKRAIQYQVAAEPETK